MFKLLLLSSALLLSAPILATPQATADASGIAVSLDQVLRGTWRDPANVARDQYRHPKQTLEFFGLTPHMTVVQLWPGGGWYTEILAPLLGDHGQLIDAAVPAKGDSESDGTVKYLAKLKADPEVYGKVKVVDFSPPAMLDLGPDGSADMVLTFRNLHNWQARSQLGNVFQAAFKVLKHGGVLGVVEHRAAPGKRVGQVFKTGYMPEDYVIEEVEKVGFRLVGQSGINANPRDTRDYPRGVWTLPPTYAEGDKHHAKYQAIGESDRMTLKFVKP
ncbi:MAG: class I SAM-dependent methyltransferase [Gammaproteobacteria bacterium]|nr:class I SAM-dependent methyltransferase [Gammaproteobacteria bacterium]